MPRFTVAIPLLVLSLSGARVATADESGDPVDPADAYCEWVGGVADSRRALLVAPELFGAAGPTAIGSEDSGDEFQVYPTLGWRVTAGIQYRIANLGRGVLTRKEADARCEEYRAQQDLRSVLLVGADVGRLPAVRSQLAVLDEALPRGERLVGLLERGLELNFATIDELYRARLQMDGLRRQAGVLRQEVAQLEALPEVDGVSLDGLLQTHSSADDQVERAQARLRRSASWAIDVRGGYDQLLNAPRDLPVFAQVRVGYNLGGLAQAGADRRAAEGRRAWRGEATEATSARVQTLREQLEGLRQAEGTRLSQVRPLVGEVEAQLEELAAIETDRAEKVGESLWLDFVKLDAERAYLEAHLAALDAFLGQEGAASTEARAGGEVAPAPASRRALDVTLGRVAQRGDNLFTDSGKMRAVFTESGDRGGELTFTTLGEARETTALGSGAVRKQLGIKLRAADSCNVVYVMWRIEPESKVVVSVKSNPGLTEHDQCHSEGYRNLAEVDVPPIEAGQSHVLRAVESEGTLRVWGDGDLLWEGSLGEEALAFDGPIGVRTDNVAVEFRLFPAG